MEVEVPLDAAVEDEFDLPGAPSITRYTQVIKHFRQQDLLHQSFLRSFGNYSFTSSHS
jgi:hypothetical protein